MLRKEGYQVSVACSGKEALEKLSTQSGSCHLRYPHAGAQRHRAAQGDQEQGCRHGRHSDDSLCFSSNGDQRAEAGASDYLTKPFDMDELKIIVRKAVERRQLIEENRYLREELSERSFGTSSTAARPWRR